MSVTIKIRRSPEIDWQTKNPTLQIGEIAFSTDTKKIKIGSGPEPKQWSTLPYLNILPSEKGISNGVASLDSTGRIPLNQIPAEVVLSSALTTSLGDYLEQGTFYSLLGVANGMATLGSDGYVPNEQISPDIARDSELTAAIVAEVTSRDSAIATHAAVTTNVHGISNTANLVIQSGLTSAISTHNSTTTNVHGIANTALLATKNYVDVSVANLVNSAPTTLDTLKELATALGNDANFSTTITTSLGTKLDSTVAASTYAPLNSPTFTGTVVIPTETIKSSDLKWEAYASEAALPNPSTKHGMFAHVHTTDSAYFAHSAGWEKIAKQSDLDLKAPLASPTFTGTVILPDNTITNAMLAGSIANNKLANSSITINGSSVSLGGSVSITGLPTQTGNNGKYLTTDGTSASWATLSTANYGNGTDTGNANKIFYNNTGTLPTGTANGDIYIQF